MAPLLAIFQAATQQPTKGWTLSITVGTIIGVLAVAGLLWIAAKAPNAALNFLLVIFGGATGWATGMLLTPLNDKEAVQFTGYGKVISAALSGYVLAKIPWDKITWNEEFFTRALLALGSFSVFVLLLFVVRSYT